MSSKKTVLKVTPIAPAPSQQKIKRKQDYLRECINSIVKRELLHLNFDRVVGILDHDLHINLKNITPRLKQILYECLCYYMKTWPGWKQYEAVCVNERAKMDYYEKFKEYLMFKMNYVIENESNFIRDIIEEENSHRASKETQTDPINKSNKPEAPYNLVISGQPNVLNNIVFIEMDNNIIIKQHAEKPWKPLNAFEFLNYSFVHVAIKLPDLELSRSNLHEFQRYITENGDVATCPDVDFITYIRKQSSSKPKVYTMDYIHAYFKQLLEIVRRAPGVNPIKKTELEEIFRQFILDINESNVFSCTDSSGKAVNTMATDTSVCFNIGKKTYIRNKKMVVNNDNQKEANAINFCEVLIPRMAYTLNKFIAMEDITTPDTSFRNLNEIDIQINKNSPELYKFVEAVNNCITYQCLLCPKVYSGDRAYIDILDHYRFLHKGEQSVLCFMCRKQFMISKLAGSRWSHTCIDGDSGVAKESINFNSDSNTANIEPQPVVLRPAIGISDILASSSVTYPITTAALNSIVGSNQVGSNSVTGVNQVGVNNIIGNNQVSVNSVIGANQVSLNSVLGTNQVSLNTAIGANQTDLNSILGTNQVSLTNVVGTNQVAPPAPMKPEQRNILPKPSETNGNGNSTNINTNSLSIDNILGNQNNAVMSVVNTNNAIKEDPSIESDINTYGNTPIIDNTVPLINPTLPEGNILPLSGVMLPFIAPATPVLSNPIPTNSNMNIPLTSVTYDNSIPADVVDDLNMVKTEPESYEPVLMNNITNDASNINLTNVASTVSETHPLINTTSYGSYTDLSMSTPVSIDNSVTVYPPVVIAPVDSSTNIMNTSNLYVSNDLPAIVTSAATTELINPLTAILTTPISSVYLS